MTPEQKSKFAGWLNYVCTAKLGLRKTVIINKKVYVDICGSVPLKRHYWDSKSKTLVVLDK